MKIETNDIIGILSKVEIFSDIDAEIINTIAEHVEIAEFKKDEFLVEHNQVGERLYFIFNGSVEVRNPAEDDFQQTRVILEEGAVIGEISLLVNSTYTADIVTLTDTTLLYLDRIHFEHLIEKYKVISEVMSNLITSRMGQSGGINKVGKYTLLGKLGEGSMATVFNAYDNELEREVAIKMLKYHLAFNPEFTSRFEQEAKIIASLSHPNIVNVYEILAEYSTRFIVMEKLPGQNLSNFQKTNGVFSPYSTRVILSQLADALKYAHNLGEYGIVHRDIKPSNIVVDDTGHIKLTDFGVAGPPSDKEINIEGSPSYLAPEIINGGAVDYRADIYALGVTAFHMLSGRLPFSAPTLAGLLNMQVNKEPPDIRENCHEIDEELATFIQKSLAKNRDERNSNWDKIQKILKPAPLRGNRALDDSEASIIIQLGNTSNKKSQQVLNTIQKILRDESLSYTIELLPGKDNS